VLQIKLGLNCVETRDSFCIVDSLLETLNKFEIFL